MNSTEITQSQLDKRKGVSLVGLEEKFKKTNEMVKCTCGTSFPRKKTEQYRTLCHDCFKRSKSSEPLISVYSAPVSNTTQKKDLTFQELADIIVGDPILLDNNSSAEKAKNGAYLVRGRTNGKRDDAHLLVCILIILDVDKQEGKLPLPTVKEIHSALSDIQHIVHSTATPGRCRIICLVKPYDKNISKSVTWAFYQLCRSRGLNFAYAPESNTKSQPFFLPQTTDISDHQAFAKTDGELFDYNIKEILPESSEKVVETLPQVIESETESKPDHNHLAAFIADLSTGTIHQAAKTYAGWLRRTTNLNCNQVFDDITLLIDLHCTDSSKVTRWNNGEREQLEQWFNNLAAADAFTDIGNTVPDWPVLSAKALPGIVGDFVELATENSEADPAAVLATFLVRFGVEVGTGPYMWIGDTPHRCRLASVIVGASSKARKGTSGKPVKRLFQSVLPEEFGGSSFSPSQSTAGPFSSGEGIIHLIRDEIKKYDDKAEEWKVVDPGVEDKRLFVLDEEFGGVLAQTKREGNTLSMIIRQMWDSGNLAPIIKNNRTIATGGHVGWVSHITLNELNMRLDEIEAFNGFANRILWVCAKRSKKVPWPVPMDDRQLHIIQHAIFKLISAAKDIGVIHPNKEAKEAWADEYYGKLSESNPGLLGAVVNRAEAQILRLAMLYTLLTNNKMITLSNLESAIAFWEYCENSARFIFHGKSQDKVARKIMEALEDGPKNATELHAVFGNNLSADRLETALRELLAAGRIEKQKVKTGKRGAPTIIYSRTN